MLDREHRRLWELDRRLQVVVAATRLWSSAGDFAPMDATDHDLCRRRASGSTMGTQFRLTATRFAIETAPGGRVFVLDRGVAAPGCQLSC